MDNQNLETIELNDLIKKINQFAKLAKERKLTKKETIEREKCRQKYLEMFRERVREQLERIEIVD